MGFPLWRSTLSFLAAFWLVRGNEELRRTRHALQAITDLHLLVGISDGHDDRTLLLVYTKAISVSGNTGWRPRLSSPGSATSSSFFP
ncbi:MAG: hypothetical protein DMG53_03430 [Acidobacteria bacterium]|nr:MAG: hypothetical protein DMG53_03430 [Acidobacteriota bacterium]